MCIQILVQVNCNMQMLDVMKLSYLSSNIRVFKALLGL